MLMGFSTSGTAHRPGTGTGLPIRPAIAVRHAVGDDACVSHDNVYEPPSPPPNDLLNLLRRIVDHDDAPKSLQADARDYLQYLEAEAFGPGPVTGEAHVTGNLPIAREVLKGLPRPRRATG